MKILMLDASTYGEDVNIDKFYALGEVKVIQQVQGRKRLKGLPSIIRMSLLSIR